MGTKKRRHRKLGTERVVAERGSGKAAPVHFRDTDADALRVGEVPLRDYLRDAGLGWVVRLRELLEKVDVSGLVDNYSPAGRHALHPRRMLGLIVYGMLVRQWSLRELELLARRDLGAMWLCGGAQPDHSAVGEFILRHAAVLTEDFFVSVTRQLVVALKLSPTLAADDGTVIEAASSRFRALTRQALAARGAAAAAAGETARAEQAAEAAAEAATRTEARREKDPAAPEAKVVPHEPEAVVQPRKDGAVRPAYKPTIKAHASRLIVGQYVHPSSEPEAVGPLLVQHQAVFDGALPATQLNDAGFHTIEVIALFAESEVDLLCPAGKAKGEADWDKASADAALPKAAFRFDVVADAYLCPTGNLLHPSGGRERDRHGRPFQRYQAEAAACAGCALRVRCTTSSRGRQVRRYEGEQYKEAMREVMAQPAARAKYRRRQGIVEPVFSALRERQGLVRFHRRGLRKVRAEFSLHAIAYNLGRAVRLEARLALLRITVVGATGPRCYLLLVGCLVLHRVP